jgi:hypothetical protein
VSAPAAARPSARPRASSADVFSRRLVLALDSVTRGQHPNGEMLSFRRDRDGNYTYVRSPFVSTFVHDALAFLDPTSPGWLDDGLDLFPHGLQSEVAHAISELRRRIRSFLMWQQDASGHWRFFGRGSGIDPDVNSTACASLALLEGHGVRTLLRWETPAGAGRIVPIDRGPLLHLPEAAAWRLRVVERRRHARRRIRPGCQRRGLPLPLARRRRSDPAGTVPRRVAARPPDGAGRTTRDRPSTPTRSASGSSCPERWQIRSRPSVTRCGTPCSRACSGNSGPTAVSAAL